MQNLHTHIFGRIHSLIHFIPAFLNTSFSKLNDMLLHRKIIPFPPPPCSLTLSQMHASSILRFYDMIVYMLWIYIRNIWGGQRFCCWKSKANRKTKRLHDLSLELLYRAHRVHVYVKCDKILVCASYAFTWEKYEFISFPFQKWLNMNASKQNRMHILCQFIQ